MMMWSSWELSWMATGLLLALIVLALRDEDSPRDLPDAPGHLDLVFPSEVHHA